MFIPIFSSACTIALLMYLLTFTGGQGLTTVSYVLVSIHHLMPLLLVKISSEILLDFLYVASFRPSIRL